jgi:AcrR family transcriptional regulator
LSYRTKNHSRTRSKAERYEEILQAVAAVIARKGYRASNIHDIAAELNLTSAALYYYVSSKQDLLVDICNRAGSRLFDALDEILELDVEPREKVRLLFLRHLQVIESDRQVFTILIQERSELPPEREEQLIAGERAYLKRIKELLEQIDDGEDAPDARLAAYAMVGMLNWALRWYRPEGRYSLDEVANDFYRIFMNGFSGGAGPAATE